MVVEDFRPSHYAGSADSPGANPFEPWKVIDACGLNYYEGSAIAYILRDAGKKALDRADGHEVDERVALRQRERDVRAAIAYLQHWAGELARQVADAD